MSMFSNHPYINTRRYLTGYCVYRDGLYADMKLNDTLCEQYQKSMGLYDRTTMKKLDQVMTASSDIGSSLPYFPVK